MSTPSVKVLPADPGHTNPFGPGTMENRTAQLGFDRLGTYEMLVNETGHADAWTLQYEETVFVVSGRASILVVDGAQETEVTAHAGELVAISEGATVRYGGDAGTRLLMSIAPADWASRQAPRRPRVLFLTPFHFERPEHDDEFDGVLEGLLRQGEQGVEVVAQHVAAFESEHEDYDAGQTRAVLDAVQQANDEGYDAIVIACHYDPAVREAREVSTVPVIAPLQLTSGVVGQLGTPFAVITDVEEAETVIGGLVDGYGRGVDCRGVLSIGWDGDAILDDTLGAAREVDRLVAQLAHEGTVRAVLIGCTIVSAAYETHRHEFPDRGVTVMNTNLITLRAAIALAVN